MWPRTLMRIVRASLFLAALTPRGMLSQQPTSPARQAFALPLTYEHSISSRITGWTYRVLVALPLSYGATDTTRLPVLYMVDGGIFLPQAVTPGWGLPPDRGGLIAPVILVGVDRPGGPDPLDRAQGIPNRIVDLTPTPNTPPTGGGAPQFLRVLREEIVPFVEREYRTTSDRGLFGHSMGGLFATYVLLSDPDLFQRYAISSPSLFWDDEVMFRREQEVRAQRRLLRKRVHLSIGGEEGTRMISLTWRMAYALRFHEGISLTTRLVEGEDHSSPVLVWQALRALYPLPSTK